MKFLNPVKSNPFYVHPGIYRTQLLGCRYIHFKNSDNICGIQFRVAWENDNGEYKFIIFSQHLEPVLRRLVADLKMKRIEQYPDGEEEAFLADLSAKLPLSVQVSVTREQVKGKSQSRFSLRVVTEDVKMGGVDSKDNGGDDVVD